MYLTIVLNYTKHINGILNETMSKIKLELSSENVWVSIDKTTDNHGRFVVNVIVGILEEDYLGKQYYIIYYIL